METQEKITRQTLLRDWTALFEESLDLIEKSVAQRAQMAQKIRDLLVPGLSEEEYARIEQETLRGLDDGIEEARAISNGLAQDVRRAKRMAYGNWFTRFLEHFAGYE